MIDIETNIAAINARIQKVTTKKNGPNDAVLMVAVSKKQPASAVIAASAAGQKHFGENYLQEAVAKIREIDDKSIVWHFLGPIQSNKTRAVAEHFDWVHSVDRLKIAQRLSDQRSPDKPPLNLCLQVNIDADPAKSGLAPPDCLALAREAINLPRLHLRGLMAITANNTAADESSTRMSFVKMRKLFESMRADLNKDYFDSLSMGMSGDMELAIEAGANIVRIGTAIFGPRSS